MNGKKEWQKGRGEGGGWVGGAARGWKKGLAGGGVPTGNGEGGWGEGLGRRKGKGKAEGVAWG